MIVSATDAELLILVDDAIPYRAWLFKVKGTAFNSFQSGCRNLVLITGSKKVRLDLKFVSEDSS